MSTKSVFSGILIIIILALAGLWVWNSQIKIPAPENIAAPQKSTSTTEQVKSEQDKNTGVSNKQGVSLTQQKFSRNVINLCEKQRDNLQNCAITKGCKDGFIEYCYFDSKKYSKNQLQNFLGFSFPNETRKSCFATRSEDSCLCSNKFYLRINSEPKEVSCEELFQAIENKNKSCGDCVDEISAGCC